MPPAYVYAAFWGGQEGTFLLWALITCTFGLVLMRVKNALVTPAMFFLNLPLVMLHAGHRDARPVPDLPGPRFPSTGRVSIRCSRTRG
jgi:hypothetical protein